MRHPRPPKPHYTVRNGQIAPLVETFAQMRARIAAKVAEDWWRIESVRMEASKAMKAGQK